MKLSIRRSSTAIISTPRIFGSWMWRNTAQREAPSMRAAW
jgi:hypothetical protein